MLFLKLHILSYGKILIDGKRLISVVFTASFQIRNRDSYCAFSCDLNNNNCIIALSLESHHEKRSRIWILDPFLYGFGVFFGGSFFFFYRFNEKSEYDRMAELSPDEYFEVTWIGFKN